MRNRFMRAFIAIVLGGAVTLPLAARGEGLAAFDGRCIPAPPQRGCRVGDPWPGCVASRSHTPGMLGRRALPAGRLARLGATPDFHHGLLRTYDSAAIPMAITIGTRLGVADNAAHLLRHGVTKKSLTSARRSSC